MIYINMTATADARRPNPADSIVVVAPPNPGDGAGLGDLDSAASLPAAAAVVDAYILPPKHVDSALFETSVAFPS